eukprot:13891375-Ditylum_brightwellii.AAC.1
MAAAAWRAKSLRTCFDFVLFLVLLLEESWGFALTRGPDSFSDDWEVSVCGTVVFLRVSLGKDGGCGIPGGDETVVNVPSRNVPSMSMNFVWEGSNPFQSSIVSVSMVAVTV